MLKHFDGLPTLCNLWRYSHNPAYRSNLSSLLFFRLFVCFCFTHFWSRKSTTSVEEIREQCSGSLVTKLRQCVEGCFYCSLTYTQRIWRKGRILNTSTISYRILLKCDLTPKRTFVTRFLFFVTFFTADI